MKQASCNSTTTRMSGTNQTVAETERRTQEPEVGRSTIQICEFFTP